MAGRLDVKRIESRLIEYQSKAQEMSVGVNYAALDNERQRQEDLLRELHQLEEEISSPLLSKTQLPELASSVGVDLDLNTKCLQYLTEISELERCVSDVAAHFAERSVELSNPNAVHSAVYTYKTLTDNVESCWDYVDQLASLAQIHLKSAAQYHQFFHEANELESKMERQLIIAENRQELSPGRRIYKETSKLANEIREQLDNMRNLWDRSKALVDRSSHIVPMRLRLGGVAKGMTVGTRTERPVMVRAMTGLIGPNYSIQQGEHLRLIDNRDDVRLWKVQTSTGIVKVPSVCFWLTGNDIEATNRAIAIKKKCRTVWLDLLERNRKRLYENFTVIMTQLASEENLYCTNYDALNDLLQDMSLLLPTSGLNDGRLQAAVDRFRRKVVVKNDMERIPTSGLVLQEPDLVRMRAPLLRLRDHLEGIRKMEAELKIIDERISEYLSEVDNEREQVYNSIELLESLTEKSQTQLKDLLEELGQWRRSSPVQEVRMRYIRAPKSKHRMEYYPELAEAPQTPLGRFRSQSQPGQEPPRGRHKSPHNAKDSEYRRARSAVSKTDVMTQIGMQSKQAETQYNSQQDLTVWQRAPRGGGDTGHASTDKRSKSTQRSLNGPTQLSVMTQIGCESKEFGNQVDKVMLRALDTEPNDYINPEDAKLQHSAPKSGKYVNSALQCRLSDGKLRTAVQQVNSCTQQGFVKRDQACSPTRDPSGECPLCHQPEPGRIRRRTGERYYDTAETLYSGTEVQAMSEFYQISEEPSNYSSDVLVCKRIQAGYPSLHPKGNLYTQVDVYKNAEDVEVGDSVVPGGTKRIQTTRNPDMNSYAQITVRPIHDNLVASTQIGVVQRHRASSPHRELSPVHVASESYALEQANMISADVEELATQPGRRNIRAQAGYPTLTNQRSASTMIFRNSMEPIPEIAETSTQNGPIVTATYVQTAEPMFYVTSEREKSMVSKRTQMGYPRFGPLCDTFAQIGSVYSQREVQTLPMQQPMIQPEPQHLVQAPVPDDGPLYAEAGAMTRTASVPEICVSSTQVGAMVAHERLSPITTEISAESKRTQAGQPCIQPKMHSWLQCTVIASDKSALTDEVVGHTELNVQSVAETKAEMVNKKFQAMSTVFDSEIQVGRLYSSSAAQTMEVQAEQELIVRPIATMECQAMQEVESARVAQIAEVAQYAPVPVLPEVASTEAQAAPIYHGKKLQVAVQPALCELAAEPAKGHNKKMQVSIELRPEHFDVSCDAVIKPETSSKKIQVEEMEPVLPMPTRIEPVFAPAPSPAPSMHEASCDCRPRLGILQAQTEPTTPTQGKKLQVNLQEAPPVMQESSCSAKQTPRVYDASVQITPLPPPIEKSHGKKLQVDLIVTPEPIQMVSALLQTYQPSVQDSAADPSPGKELFDAGVQISTPEPVVVAEPIPVVHAAPPEPTIEYSDTGCDAVPRLELNDAFSQADPVPEVKAPMIGKKLQVSVTVMQKVENSAQTTPATQSSMGVQIDAPEPVLMPQLSPVVHSAPPQPITETEDTGCDAIPKVGGYDAFAQVEPEPKAPSIGKKLQVKPPPLDTSTCQTDMAVEPQKPQLAFTGTQCVMPKPSNVGIQIEPLEKPVEPIAPEKVAVVHSAPPVPLVETEDTACDPVQKKAGYDVFTQAEPVPVEKPPQHGKKLQVNPRAPEIASCQTAQYIEKVPYEIMGTQCAPQPKVETFGKKLQVRLGALDTSSCQTELVPTVEKPVLATEGVQCPKMKLASLGIQIEMLEPVPEIVPLQPTQVVHAAPPAAETEDRACDATEKKESSDAFIQVEPPSMVEVGCVAQPPVPQHDASMQSEPEPKPHVLGKKLQVRTLNLDNKDCQTDVEKPPEPVKVSSFGVQVESVEPPVDVVAVKAAPVVHAAPPIPMPSTEDRACDAIVREKGFDVFTQSDKIPEPGMVEDGCLALPKVQYKDTEMQSEPESQPMKIGKKLQVKTLPLSTTQCQTEVARPLVMATAQCEPVKTTGMGIQVDKIEEPQPVIAPTVVAVERSAPPVPAIETEDRACDAIVKEKGSDSYTQCDPAPEISMVNAESAPIPPVSLGYIAVQTQPEPKPITLGKKLQVHTTVLATTQAQTDVVPQVIKPLLVSTQTQCIPKQMTACGVQIESAEPPVQVIATKAVPVVHAAPPVPVAKTEDRSCDAIEREKGFDVFTQSDPIRGPDMVSDGCEAIVTEAKPITLGKKLQVHTTVLATTQAQTDVVPQVVKPLLVSTQTQCVPKQMTGFGVQIESVEPPVQVIAAKAVPVVHAAPPVPVAKTEDRSCDAIEREKGFDVFTQSDPIRGPDMVSNGCEAIVTEAKPVTLGKKLQVHTTVLATTQAQTDVVPQVVKPLLVSTQTQCVPKQMTGFGVQIESVEPPVQVIAAKAVPVVHAAPTIPVAKTEDRSCDAIVREKGFDIFTQSDPIRGPDMVDDGVSALPIETKPITFGKKMQVEMSNLTVAGCQTHFVLEAPKPTISLSSAQCQPTKTTSLGIQIEKFEEPPAVVAPTVVTLQRSAPPVPVAETEDRSCDAIVREKGFDIFTQSDPIRGPDMVSDGCEAVVPTPVTHESTQCDPEEKPITFGKKLQVHTTVLATTQAQTDVVPQVVKPLLVSTQTQCIPKQMTAFGVQIESAEPPVQVIAAKAVPVVHVAPPIPVAKTEDRSCDAIVRVKGFDIFTQSDPIRGPDMVSDGCEAVVPTPVNHESTQCDPEEKPITFGKKLQVHTTVLASIQAQTDVVPQVVKPLLVSTQTQCVPKQMTGFGVQIESVEPPVQVIAAKAVPVVHAAPTIPVAKTEDRSCDAIVREKGFDIFTQSDPIRGPDMVDDGVSALPIETKPITFGKKMQVEMSNLTVAGCQTHFVLEAPKPTISLSSAQCQPTKTTSLGIQIEKFEEPPAVVAPTVVTLQRSAPPVPVAETEDRSCDAIVREKGFDIFTQSDPIRGPDMVSDGCEAVVPTPVTHESTQCDPEEKPITFGKKLQVHTTVLATTQAQTDVVPLVVKPLLVSTQTQCVPKKMTAFGVQIESAEPPVQVIAAKAVPVVHAAPPVPVAKTEDRSCDAIEREKGFDVFTQSDPIRGPDMVSDGCEAIVTEAKPITLGKKLQVHTTVLATTQAQTDVVPQVVKPLLVSTQTQCVPKQMTGFGVQIESVEPPVQVIAAKAVPVVHAAPPVPVAKTEDRSCDAIVREKGFDIFTQSDPIRGPDMVDDGVSALPIETKPITFGKKMQVEMSNLTVAGCQTHFVLEAPKPTISLSSAQCQPTKTTSLGIQIEKFEEPPAVVAPTVVTLQRSAPPVPVAETEDSSCDAIVQEKGFDVFTQSDPIRGPDMVEHGASALPGANVTSTLIQSDCPRGPEMVDDGGSALPIETKPTTFGKKMQVEMSNLTVAGCQTHFVLDAPKPTISLSSAQCQPTKTTSLGIQIEKFEEPSAVVAPTVVTLQRSAPPVPVAETEDSSCDAIVQEKGFDVFTQSDLIRGPDMVEHGASALPGANVTSTLIQSDCPRGPEMVDDGVSALPIETKPTTFGKKMQVEMSYLTVAGCQTHFVLEAPKPTISLSSAQCQPTKTTSLGIQIEKFEEPSAVVAPTVVTLQRSAPPVPVAETEDSSCDAIVQEKGFDVFTQSVPVFQPTLVSKNVQVSAPLLTDTQMQTEVRPIEQKLVLASATVQCLPTESPVDVVAAKTVPVVHAAPPLSAVETEDRGCDAIPRPDMVEDGCAALPPPEVRAPTFGKKMQVNLTVLDTTQSQTKVPYMSTTVTSDIFNQVAPVRLESTLVQASVQPTPTFVSKTILVDSASQSLRPTLTSLGVQVEGIQEPASVIAPVIAPVVKSAPPLQPSDTEDRGCDAVAGLQYSDAFVQSEVAAPTVAPLLTSSCQSEFITRPTYVYVTAQCVNIGTTDLSEPAKTLEVPADFLVFRKAQTISPVYGVQGTQVAVTEPIVEVPVQSPPALFSAPPMQPETETRDSSCDAPQKPRSSDVFVQAEIKPSQHGKKLQVSPEPLCFTACQTRPLDYVDSRPRLQSDMFIQVELPPKRPPCRGVRIQAGLPATSPKVQAQKRDGYVQSTPVVMVGTTQTFDQEEAPVVKAVEQIKVEAASPAKPTNDDTIFSFTRETVARVTRGGARKSPGLIPYKTQVFATPKQLSASMPAQLNVRVDAANTTISTTEQLTYQQAPISSNLPRRYANRLRSPTSRNFYTRRNRSAENIDGYENYVSRGMSRNFVSDYEIYTGNTCDHCSEHSRVQQSGVEQRCAAMLDAYVRRLGYETVHRTLVEVARALELEEMEVTSYASHYSSKRPRLQDARTQYTSTTSLMNAYPGIYTPSSFSERSYKSSKSIQEGNSFVQWTPLQPGEQVSIVYQSELSAEEECSFFGEDGTDSTERIGKKLLGWIRKAEPLTKYQLEAARPRLETSSDEFMKSRALSAYCSDAELQESRIKTNYSAYDAFTLVAWKANDRGDGRLELSTLGRLLKLTLVGARLPGSGDIISAAEAFYRGILRIVYFDEENSNILSLPAAINTSNVIVEKQYPPGVGIALRGDQDKYPVEAEVVWTTPELRHRSYKVNYIRKSETEKVDVLTALDDGVIDQYSGEIVNVSLGPSAVLGEPIHEARESSVGSGDTVIRRQKPERFSINEAILNDILNVEFDGQETIAPIAATTEDIQDPSGSKSGSAEPSEVDI